MWISAALFIALGLVAAPPYVLAGALTLGFSIDLYAARKMAALARTDYARAAGSLVITAATGRLLFYVLGYGGHMLWRHLVA